MRKYEAIPIVEQLCQHVTPTKELAGCLDPEQALCFAILMTAIRDLRGIGSYRARKEGTLPSAAKDSARAWLFGSVKGALVTFDDVCAALHISPSYVREQLQKHLGDHSPEDARSLRALRQQDEAFYLQKRRLSSVPPSAHLHST